LLTKLESCGGRVTGQRHDHGDEHDHDRDQDQDQPGEDP